MNSKKIVSKKTEDKLAKLYLGLPVELQENVVKYIGRSIDSSKIVVSMFDETFATYAPDARNRKVVVKLIK